LRPGGHGAVEGGEEALRGAQVLGLGRGLPLAREGDLDRRPRGRAVPPVGRRRRGARRGRV